MRIAAQQERIYFLDAMRSILMTLGIVLHSANVFSDGPWAIQNIHTSELFTDLVLFIHQFRMPAFFIVSGFFCHMTLSKYGHKRFLKVRIPRIIIPLIITAISLNSVQNWLLIEYQEAAFSLLTIDYWLQGIWVSHLWFLNCLVYYFITASVLYANFSSFFHKIGCHASNFITNSKGLYLFALPLLSLIFIKISYLAPELPNNVYAPSVSEAIRYSIYFIFGILIGFRRELLWEIMRPSTVKISGVILLLAIFICLPSQQKIFLNVYSLYIKYLISWVLCFLCFLFFYKYFNKKSTFFSYLSEASYTIYLFHHLFVIFYGLILINLELNIFFKFTILVIATFSTTTLIHQYIILKFPIFRFLFNGKRG
ncbi:MAG: glucan biosynthesis protein C [Bermanella sp.]|jgi:glucan biosynthesis protein C